MVRHPVTRSACSHPVIGPATPGLWHSNRLIRPAEETSQKYESAFSDTWEAGESCPSILLDHGRPARDAVGGWGCRCAVAGVCRREHQPVGWLGMDPGRRYFRGRNLRRLFCVRTFYGCFAIQTGTASPTVNRDPDHFRSRRVGVRVEPHSRRQWPAPATRRSGPQIRALPATASRCPSPVVNSAFRGQECERSGDARG